MITSIEYLVLMESQRERNREKQRERGKNTIKT